MADMNPKQRLAYNLWMSAEPTNKEIAESVGVSLGTIEKWKKDFGWPNRSDIRAAAENVADSPAGPVAPVAEPSDAAERIAELERQLRDEQQRRLFAEKDAADARAEAYRNQPIVDISGWLYETPERVIEQFRSDREREEGALPAKFVDAAMLQLGATNKERISRGLPPEQLVGDDLTRRVLGVAEEVLARRYNSGADNPHGTRCIKFADSQGNIRQIIVENQVNNHAGSIADSLAVYERKGFKHVTPTLCASLNCWMAAAVGPTGTFSHRGYCSPDHETLCEENKMGDDRNPALQQARGSEFAVGPRLAGAAQQR